ncbi:Rho guanine nucleotide exchange factor 5 [Chelonia mydas]|uniref:Rho guanine nucleotide exchange factor 5 n=1 Tax=Chelonia mydas TaxID=8469 RepID=M7CLL2_CHEMY|nr:Rho guanine nucleotide exchange factor 5 [Chelonia mydas]
MMGEGVGRQNILKLAPADSELASSISAALAAVGEIVSECNENVRRMKQTEELVLLEKQVEFVKTKSIPLISRGRWLVRAGEFSQVLIQEVGVGYKPRLSTKPIHLHLLSDLLLLSRQRDDGRFSVKDYAQTCHVRAELLRAKPLGLPDPTFLLCLSRNHRGASTEFILKAASELQLGFGLSPPELSRVGLGPVRLEPVTPSLCGSSLERQLCRIPPTTYG